MTIYGTTSTVTDADYDALSGPVRWEIQFWWPDRSYRRVKTQRLEWGRHVQPADPDAHLEPEHMPETPGAKSVLVTNAIIASRAAAVAKTRRGNRLVLACLREHGPQTITQIMQRTGLSDKGVAEALRRQPDKIGHDGKLRRRIWWALDTQEGGGE